MGPAEELMHDFPFTRLIHVSIIVPECVDVYAAVRISEPAVGPEGTCAGLQFVTTDAVVDTVLTPGRNRRTMGPVRQPGPLAA